MNALYHPFSETGLVSKPSDNGSQTKKFVKRPVLGALGGTRLGWRGAFRPVTRTLTTPGGERGEGEKIPSGRRSSSLVKGGTVDTEKVADRPNKASRGQSSFDRKSRFSGDRATVHVLTPGGEKFRQRGGDRTLLRAEKGAHNFSLREATDSRLPIHASWTKSHGLSGHGVGRFPRGGPVSPHPRRQAVKGRSTIRGGG